MALHYAEYTTTPANWVADTKAQIDTSTDWSNITGDIMKATTTRGAEMVINLNKAAPVNNYATVSFWETHNGGSGTNETASRYLHWKYQSGGTTSNSLHCVVSASKEHLILLAEGPYTGESNTDTTDNGSKRNMIIMADIVPYHAGDTTPAIVAWAASSTSQSTIQANLMAMVSRNIADDTSWVPATIATVQPLQNVDVTSAPQRMQHFAVGDGNTYLFPYVVIENQDGIRGRLNNAYYAGLSRGQNAAEGSGLSEGDIVTYGGNDFVIKRNVKGINVSSSASYSPFGSVPVSVSYGYESQIAVMKA
jgi:hypothetical protein